MPGDVPTIGRRVIDHKCPDTSDAAKVVIFIIGSALIMGVVGTFILSALGKIEFPTDQFWNLMGNMAIGLIALLTSTSRKTIEPTEVQVMNKPDEAVPVKEEI